MAGAGDGLLIRAAWLRLPASDDPGYRGLLLGAYRLAFPPDPMREPLQIVAQAKPGVVSVGSRGSAREIPLFYARV